MGLIALAGVILSIETSVLFHIGQTSLTKTGKFYAKTKYSRTVVPASGQCFLTKEYNKRKKIQQESVCLCTTADRLNELVQCQLEGTDHKLLHNLTLLDYIRKQVAH